MGGCNLTLLALDSHMLILGSLMRTCRTVLGDFSMDLAEEWNKTAIHQDRMQSTKARATEYAASEVRACVHGNMILQRGLQPVDGHGQHIACFVCFSA